MREIWKDREKALEGQFIYQEEKAKIEGLKKEARELIIREYCRNRCPKCGDPIEPKVFHGVPLDKCPGCGGVWLGPNDFRILAGKDHRSWFEKWFRGEE